MGEVKTLAFGESFKYKGLIDIKGLYMSIDKWLKSHGYEKQETWNYEEIFEDGKQLFMKLEPYNKISDYAKIRLRINIELRKCEDVTITKNKIKRKLMKAEGNFAFDLFLETDYENSWETKPLYFFLRTVAERFLYRSVLDRYEETAMHDKDLLKREIKSFLNMHRYESV